MKTVRNFTSSIKPRSGGVLPLRIILHVGEGSAPFTSPQAFVTCVECLLVTGEWARFWGNYYENFVDALDDYRDRCDQYEVDPFPIEEDQS